MPSYPPFPYQTERDTALEYLRKESVSEDGWTTFDNKKGVTYQKKTVPGDSSSIPLVRGKGLVEGFNPHQLAALTTYTNVRSTWDGRTERSEIVKRFGRYPLEFYSIQKGVGWIVSPRDIVGCQDTIISEDGTIERILTSVEDSERPPVSGKVRATLTLAGWVFKPVDKGTEVTYVVKVNPNGSLPITVINNTLVPEIPALISRASEVLQSKGFPPYVKGDISSLLWREDFNYSTRIFEYDFFGTVGDSFVITFDKKVYPQGVSVKGDGDGVSVSIDDDKVTVKVEGEREVQLRVVPV